MRTTATAMALCMALVATCTVAQTVAGTARSDKDQAIILFEDGTWRFDDADGIRCTPNGQRGEVCALPSEWHPVARAVDAVWPTFRHSTNIEGSARLIGDPAGRPLETEDILADIGNEVFADGLKPLVIEHTETFVGRQSGTLMVTSGGGWVHAFSFAPCGSMAVIARTSEWHTTLFNREHREAHASFVNSVRFVQC